jgi:Fur family ferric uptake transcriptional regulator
VCLDCGRVEEFFDGAIEDRQRQVAEERGFRLAEHALSLYGNCIRKDCVHRPDALDGEMALPPRHPRAR